MFTWEMMSWLFKDPNHVLFKDPVVTMQETMSWLFKDPNTWQIPGSISTMSNQTVKNGIKISNSPKWNFLSKKN